MLECHSVDTPVCVGIKISKSDGHSFENPAKFRRLIGQLLYLTIIRLDITFGVQQLS